MNALQRFIKDEDGLTAIEYVIAAAFLAVGLGLLFTNYGSILQSKLVSVLGTF